MKLAEVAALGGRVAARAVVLPSALAGIALATAEVHAQALRPGAGDAARSTTPFLYAAIFLGVLVALWALVVVRRLSRDAAEARQHISQLEVKLNEAEAVLAAEPHVLFIWRGRDAQPEQVFSDMRGSVQVPNEPDALLRFSEWLEQESALALHSSLETLREVGSPFNIGIKTMLGELLEADGRAAGGLATLRLRPLAGERRNTTELTYDTRKLGQQVRRLSAMLDAAPLAIWLRDKDGALQWVNQAYLKAVEVDEIEDVLARGLELAATKDRQLQPVAEGDDRIRKARAHAVVAGTKRTLDLIEIRLEDETAGFAIDMTKLEEAEKKLKRHIRAHASTLDKLDTAIAIFGPDKRLNFYNAAYCHLWSLEPAWLDTQPLDAEILDRLREMRRLPEQANYRDWKEQQLSAYTTLEPRESWWHLPDGQSLRVIAEQHPFGGVTYLYENVTEKFQLESRYNQLIGVQRETLDNLHEGVALFGTDGCLQLYNPSFARFWHLDADFLNHHPHVDQVIERCETLHDDKPMWDEIKYGVTGLGDSRQPLQGRIDRLDGTVYDFASVPLADGNTLLTYVDMTASAGIERALRERNEALEAADRLKTNFLSNVSYELRTPLTNIIGFSEGLSLGIAGELQAKQHEYLQHIQTSSGDLLKIIDAILDLTTIDAGAMELKLADIEVTDVLESAARAVERWIDRRDMTLSIEVAEDAERFRGDRQRVQQILTHLLSNAIGFSARGSTIRMGARREERDILFWVADSGKGMDAEFQKKAFERFQSRPIAGGHRGPGLGLPLVKSFVELHDGQVSLLSRLNKGTTVICRFPISGPGPSADLPDEVMKRAEPRAVGAMQ